MGELKLPQPVTQAELAATRLDIEDGLRQLSPRGDRERNRERAPRPVQPSVRFGAKARLEDDLRKAVENTARMQPAEDLD